METQVRTVGSCWVRGRPTTAHSLNCLLFPLLSLRSRPWTRQACSIAPRQWTRESGSGESKAGWALMTAFTEDFPCARLLLIFIATL